MDKKYLKKIIAQSPDDLQIISACCFKAKVKINDIKFLPSNKIFLLSILRFNREENNSNNLINSVIRFEFIDSSKSRNIDQGKTDLKLELIAIDLFKKDQNYEITLLFSKNAIITLTAEVIEVTLEDQNLLDGKNN